LQYLSGPRAVGVPAADGRVALAQAVAQAELEGVHPELAGDMVDVNLADVPAMEGAWRPHVPRGHEVGVDHVRLEAGVGDVVDADELAVDDDAFARHVEHARELLAQRERRLVRRNDLQPALVVEPDDAAMGLDEALVLARPDVNILHHEVGSGEDPLDILLTLLVERVAERVRVGTRPAAALTE